MSVTNAFVGGVLPTPGKTYYLTSKVSGKVLDVAGGSIADMGNIQQWEKAGVDQQKWMLEDAGDGYYFLVSKKSGKVAAVDINSAKNKNNVIQYGKIAAAEDQKWKLEDAGNGYFYLVNKLSKKFLDVAGGKPENGVNVQQCEKNGTDAQKWRFEVADAKGLFLNENGVIITEPGKTYKVKVTISVNLYNEYNDTFGIFAAKDDGTVIGMKVGSPDYAETAVKRRLPLPGADKGGYTQGQTFTYLLPGGPKYSVFLVADGTPNNFLD